MKNRKNADAARFLNNQKSWQRDIKENTNRLIRGCLLKFFDITNILYDDITAVSENLNKKSAQMLKPKIAL